MSDWKPKQAWLLFEVGDENYALQASLIRKVMTAPRLVPLPFAGPLLAGGANVSGDVVAVVKTAEWLGVPNAGSSGDLLIVQEGDARLGLLVDRVRRTVSFAAGAFETSKASSMRLPIVLREDGVDVQLVLLLAGWLPSASSLYDSPVATSPVMLSRKVPKDATQPLELSRRSHLVVGSAQTKVNLPLALVARVRDTRACSDDDRQQAPPDAPARRMSLATMLNGDSRGDEPIVVDLLIDHQPVALHVEKVFGIQKDIGEEHGKDSALLSMFLAG